MRCYTIKRASSILNIAIMKELQTSVLAAWNWYQVYLEEQEQEAQQLRHSKRRLIEEGIVSYRHKKKKLEKAIADRMAATDDYAEKAEAANDITYIGHRTVVEELQKKRCRKPK